MPAGDSPQVLIGRYLAFNGYEKTLATFLEETGLTKGDIEAKDPTTALTIEKVLDEKRLYDFSLKLEKIEVTNSDPDFTNPYPSESTKITSPDVTPSNILFVTINPVLHPFTGPVLISTAADRSLRIYSALPPHALLRNFTTPSDSAVLSVAVVEDKWLLTSSMNGLLTLLDPDTGDQIASARPHEKYAIRILYSSPYIISAAYDKTICLHEIVHDGTPTFSEEVGKLCLPTHPEALALVKLPDNGKEAIVFSRRDSTMLYYHLICPSLPFHSERNLVSGPSSWLSYYPMSISVHPTDPTLLAVATSSVPHMKFILVEIDSENVVKELFTGAPQSEYSTAVLGWRPDASGVWLNADEGVVRGLEVKSGKVVARLNASEGGEKVRTLWAGEVVGLGEVLVTGGFDKALRIWTVGNSQTIEAGA
ncbi:WD40-repeat-containing domain protein [Trichophaea hybrida]|nr:WD40-repeat-containing domain protein [Trichophaea hybrida]